MQKTRMTEFLEKLEILIDLLILHLPSDWFIDAPFLGILLSNPNGRYVLSGFLLVVGLIVLWAIFLVVQVLFKGRLSRNESAPLQNAGKQITLVDSSESNGFQFFKRSVAGRSTDSNETALKAIEQEMLTVRQRYIDGHILQDVYVAETRRLYDRAKALNS
jgi:hypothetical protein